MMKKCFVLTLMFLSFSLGHHLAAQSTVREPSDLASPQTPDAGENVRDGAPLIPNAFTPNDDGINDEFYIPGANLATLRFTAFDRWGNEVYTTNSTEFRWDGTLNGKPLPVGTYIYVLDAVTQRGAQVRRSGTISLVR